MTDAAVTFLIENLAQLALDYAELIGDVRNEVDELVRDLRDLKAFIKDTAEKSSERHILKELVSRIEEVVDKAEQVIDRYAFENSNFKAKNLLVRGISGVYYYSIKVKNVAKEIQDVRNEVNRIEKKYQPTFLALQYGDATHRKPDSLEQDDLVFFDGEDVVGFDEEAEAIIERLMKEDEDLDIITIVGEGGLGKTTLVSKVYNDPVICSRFPTRASVVLSQNYSEREVLLSILSSITPSSTEYQDKPRSAIAEQVCRYLDKTKYLIVMDNVSNIEVWDIFKSVFPNKKNGSRILITSRSNSVARHANPAENPVILKPLKTVESWKLLEGAVFGNRKCDKAELVELGIEIAKRCQGLPSLLLVVAGVLKQNRESRDWWKEVSQKAQKKKSLITEKFEKILELSYDQLPLHLKSCFLYLGVFPEHYSIPVSNLIKLWIAEGFVEQKTKRVSLEETAHDYLEELAQRNLLTVVQRDYNGRIKTCRPHNIFRDFCKREADSRRFYQEIQNMYEGTLDQYRRVCIHSGIENNYFSDKRLAERVRSFLCFPPETSVLPKYSRLNIPKAFGLLKVLEIRSITLEMFPKDLLRLALLRYIAICCNIEILPSSISRLWNLQTMIFLTKFRSLQLKEDAWKMKQLRHLVTNASVELPPPPRNSNHNWENVQSISGISPESCTQQVLSRTRHIKKLGVRGKLAEHSETLFSYMRHLDELQNLKLVNDPFPNMPSECRIPGLPLAGKFPRKLRKLTLSGTWLDWKNMQTLGELEMLEVLKLKSNAFTGAEWKSRKGDFRNLKVLIIGRTDLVDWKASEQHFPQLTRLVLRNCQKLGELPLAFAKIDSFQLLELYSSSRDAVDSARVIQRRKQGSGHTRFEIHVPN